MESKLSNIAQKYKDIIEKAEPYILSYPGNFKHYNMNPWGIKVAEQNQLSCISQKNETFFELLHRLDGIAFGPMGMPMEKWVFFDCGEMPGGIVGFGVDTKNICQSGLKEFNVDRYYKGIIPISMYISIPMANGNWFGHNLSSANRVLTNKLPGLGLFTKVLALKILNINTMLGATQWDSKALNIHLQIADMEIESAYTPAHTFKNSMTYKSVYNDDNLITSLSGKTRNANSYDFLYPADDENYSKEIQDRIENGERFQIVGRPIVENNKTFYPVNTL